MAHFLRASLSLIPLDAAAVAASQSAISYIMFIPTDKPDINLYFQTLSLAMPTLHTLLCVCIETYKRLCVIFSLLGMRRDLENDK